MREEIVVYPTTIGELAKKFNGVNYLTVERFTNDNKFLGIYFLIGKDIAKFKITELYAVKNIKSNRSLGYIRFGQNPFGIEKLTLEKYKKSTKVLIVQEER